MLTDTACRNATSPPDKPRKRLAGVGGLYTEVSSNGSKRWFAKHRVGGKEKQLALGSYPDVSLKAAREGRDLARKVREGGSDRVQVRQAEKLAEGATGATTFEAVACKFHAVKAAGWSDGHGTK